MSPAEPTRELSSTTYLYLRLALVVLMVLLAAAVVVEWLHTGPSCLQTSISGYYYTPARPVLVGVLVAVGVSLVAVKGSDEREDVLLNVAGMLAPVVAFVPTPDFGPCSSVPVTPGDTGAYSDNNMEALFVAGALALVLTALAVLRRRPRPAHLWGTAASVLVWAAGLVWFVVDRDGLRSAADYTAATGLFVVFVGVVCLNARGLDRSRGRSGRMLGLRTSYAVVAAAMVLVPTAMYVGSLVRPWAHVLLGVETALIAGFAVFWVLQTRELGERRAR